MLIFFFFNDTATTEIYPLSLHDALPISQRKQRVHGAYGAAACAGLGGASADQDGDNERRHGVVQSSRERAAAAVDVDIDRKSTRLNSSHANISYAVFCLKRNRNLKNYLH